MLLSKKGKKKRKKDFKGVVEGDRIIVEGVARTLLSSQGHHTTLVMEMTVSYLVWIESDQIQLDMFGVH